MIRIAHPSDAAAIAARHDRWRADWPEFTPESPEGVQTAITDDGMIYLLSATGTVCSYADTAHGYGFLDFPYCALDEAEKLIQAALAHLQGLRVECPLPAQREAEAELLKRLGFRLKSTQRRMRLSAFPDVEITLPKDAELCQPTPDEVEALHDLVFMGHSKPAGWRKNPDIHPVVGLRVRGELAGYVVTECHAARHLLSELGVHPEHRRQNLGRALTLLGLKQLREAGAESVHPLVNDTHDQHAPALYGSVGFQTTSHLHRYELDLGGK